MRLLVWPPSIDTLALLTWAGYVRETERHFCGSRDRRSADDGCGRQGERPSTRDASSHLVTLHAKQRDDETWRLVRGGFDLGLGDVMYGSIADLFFRPLSLLAIGSVDGDVLRRALYGYAATRFCDKLAR